MPLFIVADVSKGVGEAYFEMKGVAFGLGEGGRDDRERRGKALEGGFG